MSGLFGWLSKGGGAAAIEKAEVARKEAIAAAAAGDEKVATRKFEEAASIYQANNMPQEEASTRHALGKMLLQHSMYTGAFDALDSAARLYKGLKLERPLADCLLDSGRANAAYSRFDIAEIELSECLSIYTSLADRDGMCACLEAMGSAAYQAEDYEGATAWYTRAKSMQAEARRPIDSARCSLFLSSTAAAAQDFAVASDHFQEALRQLRHADFGEMAEVLADVGSEPYENEDEASVNDLLNAALTFCSALTVQKNSPPDTPYEQATQPNPESLTEPEETAAENSIWLAEISTLEQLAPLAYQQNRTELARELAEQALQIAAENGGVRAAEIALHVLNQAGVHAVENCDLPFARTYFNELKLKASAAAGSIPEADTFLALANYGEARAALLQMELDVAENAIKAALDLFKSAGSLKNVGRCLNLYGQVTSENGDTATAINLLKEAVNLARKSDDTDGAAAALASLGAVAAETDAEYAEHFLQTVLQTEPIEPHTSCRAARAMAEVEVLRGDLDSAYTFAIQALDEAVAMEDIAALPGALECTAHIACQWGNIETSVLLYARADQLRDRYGMPRGRRFDARFETDHAGLRQDLGEAEFEKAWTEGLELEIDDLVEEAEALLPEREDEEAEGDEYEA
jgi:tetratricopeptide (TPR) repeat protein